MLKRMFVTGLIGATAGLTALTATPALAGDNPANQQLINIQFCRDLIPVISNLLAVKNQQGDCYNGAAGTEKSAHIYRHEVHKQWGPKPGLPNTD